MSWIGTSLSILGYGFVALVLTVVIGPLLAGARYASIENGAFRQVGEKLAFE